MRKIILDKEDVNEIVRLYTQEKWSINSIRTAFYYSEKTLSRILKNAGVEVWLPRKKDKFKEVFKYSINSKRYIPMIYTPDCMSSHQSPDSIMIPDLLVS